MIHLQPRPGKRLCRTCLWLWPGLKGESKESRRCHNAECRYYRRERATGDKACQLYEARPQMVGWAEEWRKRKHDRNRPY